MDSKSVERFRKRQALKGTYTVYDKADDALVKEMLNSSLNTAKVDNTFTSIQAHYDTTVTDSEVQEFLDRFKKEFSQARFDQMISDMRNNVIQSIATPFGLGKVVAVYDKTGGNVDTIHNVRNNNKNGFGMSDDEKIKDGFGIYATTKEKETYKNRGGYNSNEYHKDPNFIRINKNHSDQRKEGKAVDYMTGLLLDPHTSCDEDHLKSGKENHDDAGRVLAGIEGKDLANTDSNLKPTDYTNNRAKKADSMETFIARKNENLKEIEILQSKPTLTESEQNRLNKLKKFEKIDDKKALDADKKARDEIDEKINYTYYTSNKFIINTTKTSVVESGKMGLQQAFGAILVEIFASLIDEVIDIYKNGWDVNDDGFFMELGKRLQTISNKITAKWKEFAKSFKDGSISGFISNIVTVIINMFETTGKRIVRIIREGIFSLLKALKILIFPPEGLSYSDALHEAKKLMASGMIISGGVLLEEWLDKVIRASVVLEPFADILIGVLAGTLTGLVISLALYYIDKKKNDKDAITYLLTQTNDIFDRIDAEFEEVKSIN